MQVENFTVTFSDGRVLCYLIHHYHPSLLPEEAVSHSTTQTVECSPRGRLELNCSASDSDNSFDSLPTGLNGTCQLCLQCDCLFGCTFEQMPKGIFVSFGQHTDIWGALGFEKQGIWWRRWHLGGKKINKNVLFNMFHKMLHHLNWSVNYVLQLDFCLPASNGNLQLCLTS